MDFTGKTHEIDQQTFGSGGKSIIRLNVDMNDGQEMSSDKLTTQLLVDPVFEMVQLPKHQTITPKDSTEKKNQTHRSSIGENQE